MRVVGAGDGADDQATSRDTIVLLDLDNRQHKIRFNGIDTPEKGQPSDIRSKQYPSRLIYARNVHAEFHKRDRYGREVGKVLD